MIILSSLQFSCKIQESWHYCLPQEPHSHILMMRGGGGGLSDFFWSEILAKGDFFGSMKNAGIFGVVK